MNWITSTTETSSRFPFRLIYFYRLPPTIRP
jgi:hypothetical protein